MWCDTCYRHKMVPAVRGLGQPSTPCASPLKILNAKHSVEGRQNFQLQTNAKFVTLLQTSNGGSYSEVKVFDQLVRSLFKFVPFLSFSSEVKIGIFLGIGAPEGRQT